MKNSNDIYLQLFQDFESRIAFPDIHPYYKDILKRKILNECIQIVCNNVINNTGNIKIRDLYNEVRKNTF